MGAFVEWGKDGVSLRESAELTPELRAAISEVSETITEHGGTVRFKLHDKKGALDSLARHLGMFPSKVELTGKDGGVPMAAIVNVTIEKD